jgi:hypothetical protein
VAYDEKTADRVRQVLADRLDVVEKQMMGGLCFMVRAGMCCSVSGKGGLLVRVGVAGQESALRQPHVQPMKMGRKVMSGFVRVAPEGLRTDAQLRNWVLRGVACVESLPPKPARGRPSRRRPKKA